jgi:hypothetical protein
MRPDQFAKLESLQERLIDLFLAEAEPANLPGAGLPIGSIDRDSRGDLYWCKRNAAASIALASRITAFQYQFTDLQRRRALPDPNADPDDPPSGPIEPPEIVDDVDKEIAGYEKLAQRMIAKAAGRVGQQ